MDEILVDEKKKKIFVVGVGKMRECVCGEVMSEGERKNFEEKRVQCGKKNVEEKEVGIGKE